MPRTKPTPAQIEKAQARREEAAATLAQGVEHVAHDPAALAAHLQFCALFRSYSFRNTLLLAEQARARGTSASFFKGYRAWQQHGRQVQKGEHGYMLFAPIVRKLTGEKAREAKVPEGTRAVVGYRVATVFDIDQTAVIEGQEDRAPVYVSPIPQLEGDDFADLRADLEAVARSLGYTVGTFAARDRRAGGFCDPALRRIGVKAAPANQQAAVLAHELAHALAHTGPEAADIPKNVREVQAEGAAYLACYALGLDTSAATLPYLRTWTAEAESEDERRDLITAQLGAIDRIGWRLVELVEAAREGTVTAESARPALEAPEADSVSAKPRALAA
ncbi:ArdC family protein [Rubrivirga sp. S365]|uniref:ArdC family protein n=1 Tax=Rubrivirga sp. S365 TaxID=3076080 RepID=UPI0028C51389|nr:ArdC family protein [Rubrivirga sp. S365]MDT7858141.1 ArdC family protein [Rubrivirga sp. S365]